MNEQLDVLDILTILSFAIQLENQKNIIGIADVQKEVNRAVEDIHQHLADQDNKLSELLGRGNNEGH